jgi:glycosyltransferase involved in cell wall biosynthesis
MGQKILAISMTPSHPQNAGNRTRINNFLLALQERGHEIHFLHIAWENGNFQAMKDFWREKFYSVPYKAPLIKPSKSWRIVKKIKSFFRQEHLYIYKVDDWYDPSVDKVLKELQEKEKFDTIIVEYVFLTKALENFDRSVLKIVDTHDIFTNRHKVYLKKGQVPKWYFTSAQEEAKGLKRADIIIAIQPEEAKFFKKLVKKTVITVGHLVSLRQPTDNKQPKPNLLFIGSSNPINIHGFNYFLEKIFPLVRSHYPSLQVLIAGEICNVLGDCEGCIKLGQMEDIAQAYRLSDIVINPVLFGTGLKIKSVEALGYAKALVTTSAGAVGLEEGKNTAFLVADKPSEFAEKILDILGNPRLFERLAENAYSYAEKLNQNHLQSLQEILGCQQK